MEHGYLFAGVQHNYMVIQCQYSCDSIVYVSLPKWTNSYSGQTSLAVGWLDAWNAVPVNFTKLSQLASDLSESLSKGAAIVPWDFSDLVLSLILCVWCSKTCHLPTIATVQLLQDTLNGLFRQWVQLSWFLLLSLCCNGSLDSDAIFVLLCSFVSYNNQSWMAINCYTVHS
jgi:hypothetical protein